jgi:hypothetical protein
MSKWLDESVDVKVQVALLKEIRTWETRSFSKTWSSWQQLIITEFVRLGWVKDRSNSNHEITPAGRVAIAELETRLEVNHA